MTAVECDARLITTADAAHDSSDSVPVTMSGEQRLSPRLDAGLSYWHRLRRGRRMPARADIEPTQIGHLLPHIILVDIFRDPLDFGYRLIGTQIESYMERSLSGRRLSGIAHQGPLSAIWRNFETVVESRAPRAGEVPCIGPHGDFLELHDITMPLSANGHDVDMLFVVAEFRGRA